MTPHQLNMAIEENNKKSEEKQKEMIHHAYLISRWVWQKKIDIEKILNTKKEKKVTTDNEMLKQVEILNMIFGGEVNSCNS